MAAWGYRWGRGGEPVVESRSGRPSADLASGRRRPVRRGPLRCLPLRGGERGGTAGCRSGRRGRGRRQQGGEPVSDLAGGDEGGRRGGKSRAVAGREAGVVSAHGSGGRGRERRSARDFQIAALRALFQSPLREGKRTRTPRLRCMPSRAVWRAYLASPVVNARMNANKQGLSDSVPK